MEEALGRVKAEYKAQRSCKVKQYNIIIDVLGGYSADVSHAVKELVGERECHSLTKNAEICHIEYTKHCAQFQMLA